MQSPSQLPVELTEEIAGSLCLYCAPTFEPEKFVYYAHRWSKEDRLRVKTLASLCLTSKTLSEIATRHLYHYPITKKRSLLARTLITAPGKARHVRDLRFGSSHTWPSDKSLIPAEVVAYCNERTDTYVPVCGSVEDFDRAEYFANYNLGGPTPGYHNDNVSVDVITSLCPNVERLEATLTYFQAFCFCTPNSLMALTHLNLRHPYDTQKGLHFDNLMVLFRAAPNLTSMYLSQVAMDEPDEETDDYSKHVPVTLNFVKLLRLRYSVVGKRVLAVILRTCPNLETLEYQTGPYPTQETLDYQTGEDWIGKEQFTPVQAKDVILRYAPSLRTFSLDLTYTKMDLHHVFDHDEDWQLGLEEAEEALISRGIDYSYYTTQIPEVYGIDESRQ